MKPYTLDRTVIIQTDLATAWDFFSKPDNLPEITPPSMDFRITSEPQDVTYAGQIITYTLRPLMGISMAWTTEITHVSKPSFFVDEQRFGPYRFWHHQHFFRQVDEGVEMRDLVHYLLPHMQFTALVNRLIVMPRLKKIFDYRAQALQKIFTRN
jgi:ligand-binding SRPBCC domain-containing protein